MNSKFKTLLSISLVAVLTVVLHYFGWLSPAENYIRKVINPVSAKIHSVALQMDSKKSELENTKEIKKKYQNLQQQLKTQKVDQANLKLLKQENDRLKKRLNFFKNKKEYKHIGAQVIGKNIEQIGNTLVIDKGSADGIKKDNPAIVLNGVLIGKVAEVNENSSIIRLLHDNQSKVGATLLNKDRSIGLVEGGYGINVRMNYIPQNEEIDIGSKIVTSGLSDDTPRGLVIGTVEAIEKEPYQPFQRAVIKPVTDLNKVASLSVITSVN